MQLYVPEFLQIVDNRELPAMHFTAPFTGIMEWWNDGIVSFRALFVNTFIEKPGNHYSIQL
jgi:hypothetical protein